MLGAVASCWKLSSRKFTFARCATGRFTNAGVIFFGLAVLGAAASCWKLSSREFTFQLVVATSGNKRKGKGKANRKGKGKGRTRERKGNGKKGVGALAAPLGCWKASAGRCSPTLGYLQLDTCTC